MELKEIIALYRRWIGLLIVGLVMGLAAGLLVSKLQTPVYEASTKVLVARNRQQGTADILSLTDQQLVSTYQQLLKTHGVLEEAGANLGLSINPDNLRVTVLLNTQIIQITVQDTSPERAVAIANGLVQVLVEENETLQAGRYAAYQDGLNTQIVQVQQQIADLQAQIYRLDQANIQEQLAQVTEQIASLQAQILDLERDVAGSPQAFSSAARASLAEKQAELDQLRSLLALYQEIQTNLTYIGKPLQGGAAPDVQVASLQSTLGLYQQLYLSLLNNLEDVKLARAQSTPTITQIEAAVLPKAPVRPLRLLYTAVSGLVGLLLAAGAILLIDYFDDSFRTAQKVRELLRAPVLGEIADFGSTRPKWIQRRMSPERDAVLRENAFGALRMNLFRLMARQSRKTILITSAWPGEGKTTVSVDLARSFAQAGKRVTLVDADLAHPQVHSRFAVEKQPGLTEILAKGADWQTACYVNDRIAVIPSGGAMAGAHGLLESEKMTALLKELELNADIVIVDGPPLFVLNAQVLASKVGGVLLVIRQGETKTSIARSVTDQLELMEVPLLGVVLNGVPRSASYYYDGYMGQVLKEEAKSAKDAEQD